MLSSVYDEKCILDVYAAGTEGVSRYWIDSQTGEVKPLQLTYTEDGKTSPVKIKLETATLHRDGTEVERMECEPQYAWILKEDYWNNVPCYQPIAPLENSFAA